MSTASPAPAPDSPHAADSSDSAAVAGWRILLRLFAGFLAMFSFAFWAAAGWNHGWTRTIQVPVKSMPLLGGHEVAAYKDHFLPGLDLFIPALLLCATLFVLTFIWSKRR